MIILKNIEKSYPDGNNNNCVLRNVNLTLEKGEFVAITGESGSGKTTLLYILGTLLTPDHGTYLLDGEIIDSHTNTSNLRNRKIGFVFQEHRLMLPYSLRQNILLPTLATQNKATDEQMEYADFLMNMTDISPLAERFPSSVSGGEASRAALCRALIMKPVLLLADEPTGQLDSRNAKNIVALLRKINSELETTILMVSHSKETAAGADRALNLKDGLLLP